MKEIPLTRGQVALVDDEDYEELAQYKWHALLDHKSGIYYAARNARDGKNSKIFMHNVIMGGKGVDHINGIGTDNRRCNLRFATLSQNMANSKKAQGTHHSKYKGVTYSIRQQVWQARIMFDKKRLFLGYFKVEEDAARAYDKAAYDLFGSFAFLNFPEEYNVLVRS